MIDEELIIEVDQEFFRKHLDGKVIITAVGKKYIEFERQDTGIISIITKKHFESDYKKIENYEDK